MNLPNKLTIFRILLVPVLLVVLVVKFPMASWVTQVIAAAVFIIASLTDMADGKIARKNNLITDFGKFMDPLADKVLVLSAMCFFVEQGQMPGWAVAVVLVREFAVSGLRLVAAGQGNVIAADISGKIKTVSTMICLGTMLVFPQINFINVLSTAVIVISTLWSGVHYFVANKGVLKL